MFRKYNVFIIIGIIEILAALVVIALGVNLATIIFSLVCGFLGIGFLSLGILLARISPLSPRQIKQLMEIGRKLNTEIVSAKITFYYGGRAKRLPLWVIKSVYTENGKTYEFYSTPIKFNVTEIINKKGLKHIHVWVDSEDMKNYHMVIDDLEKISSKQREGL